MEYIVLGICSCGCGEKIPIRNTMGIIARYKHGHNSVGLGNPSWKGGRKLHSNNYILARCEGHPKAVRKGQYVYEHVLAMEKHLGRYLNDGEIVHHINGNTQDNRLENLQLMTRGDHQRMHLREKLLKKHAKIRQ